MTGRFAPLDVIAEVVGVEVGHSRRSRIMASEPHFRHLLKLVRITLIRVTVVVTALH
jgi:hypothetical protein